MLEKPKVISKPAAIVFVEKHYIKSLTADRSINGFGVCKKGEWVEVPLFVFNNILAAVKNAQPGFVKWATKTEKVKVEG